MKCDCGEWIVWRCICLTVHKRSSQRRWGYRSYREKSPPRSAWGRWARADWTHTNISFVTDLCFNVTSTAKAEELACKKLEMNISPSNMENRKWAEETEAHPCGHSSNHHHPFPNRLHQESFYSHRWNYFLNKMWFMLMFQNISKN